jgi:hypothetical protein
VHKICFIIPYFGKNFPDYFDYFIKSAKWNPTIDFLIFTDINYFCEEPNITFEKFSLKDFNLLATDKLEMTISIDEPYKLCDFKPAYGKIFEDYLSDYEFWGHCDIDLIFGNIRNFMNEKVLNNYDVISSRKEYLSGFFTLYRNNNEINNLFKKSKDWVMIFKEKENFCFDECNFQFYNLFLGKNLFELESEIESMTHVVYKNNIRTHLKTICHEFLWGKEFLDVLNVDKNGLFSVKTMDEFLLVHLIKFKKQSHVIYFPISDNSDKIIVNRYTLCNYDEENEIYKEKLLQKKVTLKKEEFSISKDEEERIYLNNIYADSVELEDWHKIYQYFEDSEITGNEIIEAYQNSDLINYFSREHLKHNIFIAISDGLLYFECLKVI